MRSGQPIPDRILNAPELHVCLEFFITAFHVLTTCRQSGMGIGPIPATAILEYGRFYGCDHEMMNDLLEYVMMLDRIFIDHESKKLKRKAKKP